MNKTLISVVGPTAIGKTKLAISLAVYFNTEIISADSRQFYKEMSIGTAVPDASELNTVPHHFIQHTSIFDSYSVGDFEKDVIDLLERLFKKHDTVIMVGGSGLYVDAVTKGLDEFPKIDPKIRAKLNEEFMKEGIVSLQRRLKVLDKDYYSNMDIDNPHRLIRALEVCIGSGRPYSSFLNKKKDPRPFNTVSIGIMAERDIIYERINRRVDIMIKDGLLEEAKELSTYRDLNALQTVGYKELFQYFDGNWEMDHAISEIKKNTRRFAKRQLTWFKRNKKIIWVEYDDSLDKFIDELKQEITKGTHGIE